MSAIADRVLATLADRPAGLLSDIDGTISRITAPPEAAVVDPAARAALARLASHLDLVGVITGRRIEDARRLVGLDQVVCIGNHGLERFEGGRIVSPPEVAPFRRGVAEALDAVARAVAIPGVTAEDKGLTGSVHYRLAQDPERAREAILRAVTPIAEREGLRISEGRMVIEIRPPGTYNKGTALVDLVTAFRLRSLAFLGDDVTDLDAMRALVGLRDAGTVSGLAIGVAGSETPAEIPQTADVVVDGVDGVIALLGALADRLERSGQQPFS